MAVGSIRPKIYAAVRTGQRAVAGCLSPINRKRGPDRRKHPVRGRSQWQRKRRSCSACDLPESALKTDRLRIGNFTDSPTGGPHLPWLACHGTCRFKCGGHVRWTSASGRAASNVSSRLFEDRRSSRSIRRLRRQRMRRRTVDDRMDHGSVA